jgi:peroxiredoxin/uncharacterized membrane protein YphA (DoxX/SURF4 family)
VLLSVIRAMLAGVFALAGVSKLVDLPGSRAAVLGFGAPERLGRPLAVLVPLLELAAVALLAFQATARVGAALALALLLVFSAAIARSMARGEAPECHCFGQMHSAPAGPRTLARNLALAALAAAVLLVEGEVGASLGSAGLAGPAAAAACLVLLALVIRSRSLRRNAALAAPDVGPTIGSPAPEFEVETLEGATVTLASLRCPGRPVLLAFTDPRCGPCRRLLPRLGDWQRRHAASLTIAVISRGDAEEIADEAAEHEVSSLLQERDQVVSRAYGAMATPSAILVGEDGRIASAVVAGEPAIAGLVSDEDPSAVVEPLDLVVVPVSRRNVLRRFAGVAGAAAMAGPASLLFPGVAEARCPKHRRCRGRCCPKNSHCRHGRCRCNPGFTKRGRKCVPRRGGGGSPSQVCGNGVREGAEQCDGGDLGGKTCVGLGLGAGTLACSPGCAFDTSGCGPAPVCSPGATRSCYTGPVGSEGIGICHGGTQTCDSNGTWGPCVGETTPQSEICGNGLDDDCDGVVDNGCCTSDAECGASTTCVSGQCQTTYADATTVCAPSSCSGGFETPARYCDGAGGCSPAIPHSCSPYVCNGPTDCYTGCTGDFQCAPGFHCSGGFCVPT